MNLRVSGLKMTTPHSLLRNCFAVWSGLTFVILSAAKNLACLAAPAGFFAALRMTDAALSSDGIPVLRSSRLKCHPIAYLPAPSP